MMKLRNTSDLPPHEPRNNILMNTTTFWSRCKWHYSWTKPINSSDMHFMNPETHYTFMCDEPRWRS